MGVVEELVRARDAYDRRDWLSAYEGLSEVEADALTAADFFRLATVAFLLGHRNDCVQAMQRAHRLHLDAGEPVAAARCGLWLGMVLELAGEPAVAGGWVSRSERLLDQVTDDVVERGYLLIDRMYGHVFSGAMDQAMPLATEAEGYGRRFGDADLTALAVSSVGSDADAHRQGAGGAGPPRRVHDRDRGRRGRPVGRGDGLLLDDRGLPGGRGLRPGRGVDDDADPLVRGAARPGPVHGAVRGPPWPDHAGARCVRRRARGARAGAGPLRPGRLEPRRGTGLGRTRRGAAHPRRPPRGGVGVRARRRARPRAPAEPRPALARPGAGVRGDGRRRAAALGGRRPGRAGPAAPGGHRDPARRRRAGRGRGERRRARRAGRGVPVHRSPGRRRPRPRQRTRRAW